MIPLYSSCAVWVQREADKRKTVDTVGSEKGECISDKPNYSQALSEIFGHNHHIDIIGYIMHSSDSMKKDDVRTDKRQSKIKEDSVEDDQQKYEIRDAELVQHLNCHTKQSAMDGPDV